MIPDATKAGRWTPAPGSIEMLTYDLSFLAATLVGLHAVALIGHSDEARVARLKRVCALATRSFEDPRLAATLPQASREAYPIACARVVKRLKDTEALLGTPAHSKFMAELTKANPDASSPFSLTIRNLDMQIELVTPLEVITVALDSLPQRLQMFQMMGRHMGGFLVSLLNTSPGPGTLSVFDMATNMTLAVDCLPEPVRANIRKGMDICVADVFNRTVSRNDEELVWAAAGTMRHWLVREALSPPVAQEGPLEQAVPSSSKSSKKPFVVFNLKRLTLSINQRDVTDRLSRRELMLVYQCAWAKSIVRLGGVGDRDCVTFIPGHPRESELPSSNSSQALSVYRNLLRQERNDVLKFKISSVLQRAGKCIYFIGEVRSSESFVCRSSPDPTDAMDMQARLRNRLPDDEKDADDIEEEDE